MEPIEILTLMLTGAVAVSTFLVWRATRGVALATQNVAEATEATKQTMKEVGSYSIMPHLSIESIGVKEKEQTYDVFEFKIANDGNGDAFNMRMEISSDEISTTVIPPFNLPRGNPIFKRHSVKKESKLIHFKIIFEDLAGNPHERIIDVSLTDRRPDPIIYKV